ncbi:hypothetical protein PoB_000571200 [Plakobranchus ocellatus]|uniref:Uncharacterized protein n=1 Tax=Plakobranchus ocellatus TaxID=259542 RepID=A0AAV3YAR1_9GAST|nr:hypothetical protein PoB_000571200 [Plakobranchus ocellatus]
MSTGLFHHESKIYMEVAGNKVGQMMPTSTRKPKYEPCLSPGHRHCADGSCMDLCPEDQAMSQNTILIMIVVGIVVVIFLTVLYCFQQRSQRLRQNSQNVFESVDGEGVSAEHASLNNPPPTYEEVINSNLYPPTPVAQRTNRTPSLEEPRTPPPNYDAALYILAHSSESVLHSKHQASSPVVRRSVSSEQGLSRACTGPRASSSETEYRRILSNPEDR